MRVVFPFIAQSHQIPHSLPIAVELAKRHPAIEVHVAYTSPHQLTFIRGLVELCGASVPLHYHRLRVHWIDRLRGAAELQHAKFLTLWANRRYFAEFDAIVTPEQTSLLLRKLGVSRPKLIWTRHGAGDREGGFRDRTRQFDFVLLSGHKIERRLLSRQLIKPGQYATGVYAKLDWVRRLRPEPSRLFDNGRPTVLYNPHFRAALSSWPHMGWQVLDYFSRSTRFNLIFAPHVRLFDGVDPSRHRAFQALSELPHILIDPGSERSIDMTYTAAADIYLGDVSSQVVEFLLTPRPCLFLNAHDHPWQGNPSFQSWSLGPVTSTSSNLERQIEEAMETHDRYIASQCHYITESFGVGADQSSALRGGDAIASFLHRSRHGAESAHGISGDTTPAPGLRFDGGELL